MNIGIVTTWHEGGAGYVSRAYRDVLQAQGSKVQIYARGGRYDPVGDPVWDLPEVAFGKRYTPPRFSKFTDQYIDMVHFENWVEEKSIHILIFNEELDFVTIDKVKKLGCVAGLYVDYYTRANFKRFEVYDFLLCNTKRHYSVFCDFPCAFYIPWGTDTNLFKPRPQAATERDAASVFFHSAGYGGTKNRKGTDILLKAFQKVRGNARLIIHSQVPLGKFGDASADIVRSDPRIDYIEKTVPAPGLYHLGDAFVYPSRLEGIGLCVPEALACGMPVITTDNAPMNEFVEDGVNGFLVRVTETKTREDGYYWPEKIADIDDLAEKMQIYVDDKNLLESHKRQARESAVTRLDWAKNASGLAHMLEALLGKSDRRKRRPRSSEQVMWWCEAKYVALLTCALSMARKVFRRK
jgi:1,2-diacylglycerol 3-alpha-glucosyltransferase